MTHLRRPADTPPGQAGTGRSRPPALPAHDRGARRLASSVTRRIATAGTAA